MNIETLKAFFMWNSLIHFCLLMIAALIIANGATLAYSIHSRWFKISREAFDIAIYSFLGLYKLLMFFFCIIPWAVLCIIG